MNGLKNGNQNGNGSSFSLRDDTNFQTVDLTQDKADDNARTFVDEIDNIKNEEIHPSRNPWLRIGLGVGLLSFVFGFGVLSRLGSNEPVVVENSEDETITAEEQIEIDQAAENERLRSELALLEQQMELSSMDRKNVPDPVALRTPPSTTPPASKPRTPDTTPTRVQNRPASPPVRPVSTARPATPPPRVITRTVTVPSQSSQSATASAPSSAAPTPAYKPLDPQEAWLAASNAGIMGAMPTIEPVANEPGFTDVFEPEFALKGVTSEQPSFQPASDVWIEEVAVISELIPGLTATGQFGQPGRISLGTMASAEVRSPITWLDSEAQFVIELVEDVIDSAGTTAIPAGSFAIVQPADLNTDNGQAKLAVVGFDIGGQTIAIDYRSVALLGEGGDPLVADRYGDMGGEIASNDMEMFAIGALSGIGQILTRPDSQITTTGTFGSTTSTENGDRNILGAVLAGGTDQLVDRMGQRNDDRLATIRDQEQIFYLPEGKNVTLYFNEEFQL